MPYRKIKAPEWQIFRLQRDVKEINRSLASAKKIGYFAIFESSLLITSFLLDKQLIHIVPFWMKYAMEWLALGGIVFMLGHILHTIAVAIISLIRSKALSLARVSRKDCVDSFDDDICYFVMVADSYSELTATTISPSMQTFYYIETSFYLNKSIVTLYKSISMIKDIYRSPTAASPTMMNNAISRLRLCTLLECMREIQEKIKAFESIRGDSVRDQKTINDTHQKLLDRFTKTVMNAFH